MTVRGASAYMNQRATVRSVGDGPTQGWTKVLELPRANLPRLGATEEYVFVAWASAGHVLPTAFPPNTNACVEIALGSDSAPFQDSRVRWEFTFAHLQQVIQPGRVLPATWVRGFFSSDRGTWDASTSGSAQSGGVALWARIYRNGDPAGTVAGEFEVANAGIQAYAIGGLASGDYWYDRFAPATPQPCAAWAGSPTSSLTTFHLSTIVGVFSGVGDWLLWGSTRYLPNFEPGNGDTAACFQITYSPDGTVGAQVPLIGGHSGSTASWKCGIQKKGARPGGAAALGRWGLHETGGFAILSNPASAAQIGSRGFDWNAVNNVAAMDNWEVFAIRGDTKLGAFDFISKDRDTVGNIFNPNLPQLGRSYEPKEFSRPFHSSLELLMTASYDLPLSGGGGGAVGSRNRSYALAVESNGGGVNISHNLWNWTFNRREGVLAVLGETVRNVRQLDIQMRFFGWHNPIEPQATDYQFPIDFAGVQFVWDDAVNSTPNDPPLAGPVTGITVGRETIQVISLPVLPFEPEDDFDETILKDKHRLVTSDGHAVTWPKFFGARRTIALRWVLNATDTDTLRKFFDDRDDRAFAWTPPQESAAVAFVQVGRPQTADVGSGFGYETKLTVAELIWVGP